MKENDSRYKAGKQLENKGSGVSSSGLSIEVPQVAKSRRFSAPYKLRILDEVDRCTKPQERAAIARREGIYSSSINKWMQWRDKMNDEKEHAPDKSKSSKDKQRNLIRKLERENKKLSLSLKKAESIIELQKKVYASLEGLAPDTMSNGSNL
jgi:transposase-like protein